MQISVGAVLRDHGICHVPLVSGCQRVFYVDRIGREKIVGKCQPMEAIFCGGDGAACDLDVASQIQIRTRRGPLLRPVKPKRKLCSRPSRRSTFRMSRRVGRNVVAYPFLCSCLWHDSFPDQITEILLLRRSRFAPPRSRSSWKSPTDRSYR